MREPDWDELSGRLSAMTVKQLRSITSAWFVGSMGGASTKRDIVHTMCGQMRNWWRNCAEWGGRERVKNVLKTISEVEAA